MFGTDYNPFGDDPEPSPALLAYTQVYPAHERGGEFRGPDEHEASQHFEVVCWGGKFAGRRVLRSLDAKIWLASFPVSEPGLNRPGEPVLYLKLSKRMLSPDIIYVAQAEVNRYKRV